MPKAPILDREAFLYRTPEGSLSRAEFNIVNTNLGGMIEPSEDAPGAPRIDGGFSTENSREDSSVNRYSEVKRAQLGELMTTGLQTPSNW